MDSPDSKKLSEIVDRVRSWIPRKTEPVNLSRDFWMPDQSCRVCYECDAQFTVFNRRHHCRICGRVFCAKCASNTIPALGDECNTSREDWERIRVCNYCFKQWELGITTVDNGNAASSPGISPSSSVTSLISMHSGGTCNSRSTAGSIPYSTGPYQHVPYASESGENPLQGDQIFDAKSGEDQVTCEVKPGSSNSMDPFPDQFGPCIRSDEEEEDYSVWGFNSEPSHLQSDDRCYDTGNHIHINENCTLRELDSDEGRDKADLQDLTLLPANAESNSSEVAEKFGGAAADGLMAGVSDGVAQYDANAADCASLDFEKNGILWLPPEPENEEDEQESLTFDDDDDGVNGVAGDWGYLRSSRSFGGMELGNRERTIEEYRNTMKNLLDDHFRSLISQLLEIENLPASMGNGKDSWLDIISSLSWEAATLLKPDMSKTGGMDPGIYVKVKCIASGHLNDSMVIKGVVCKKNVAHRRMASKIDKARFIILGGALEYQRVANHLSSFDTLLQQEMDHLKMAVAKIDAHHPNVLLVEKSVSRFAQEYLLAKDITLVLNIKRPLLERIARCTGAQIVPSVDHITAQKVGYCDLFHVEKFFEEHGSARQGGKKMTKTLMFFDGCPKPLGCTILLRGASGDELKKVKHVLHYGVFAAYHLALETSFLADEGASLPEVPLKSPIKVALPANLSSLDKSISFVSGSCASAPKQYLNPQNCVENVPRNDLIPHCTSRSLSSLEMKSGLSGSPSATQMALAHMNSFDYDCSESNEFANEANCPTHLHPPNSGSVDVQQRSSYHALGNEEDREPMNECLADGTTKSFVGEVDDNLVSGCCTFQSGETAFCPPLLKENSSLLLSMQVSSEDNNNNKMYNDNNEVLSLQESCPPADDHQSILVSLTTRCEWKGTVCERAHLFRIKYYGSFDKPLGRFLRDHLFDQSYRCHSCEMPSAAHIHCYTHRQGSLTISVRRLQDFVLPGERDGKIWMWHRCLRCPRRNAFPPATRRVVMSDAAWGLSFGKFLELSFSNHAAASRVASCGHSLHRDCLRFYGFGRMVACFRYAPIDVNSVYLPPPKLEFTYDGQEWIQKEADEVLCRAESLFMEVVESLRQILEKTLTDNGGKYPRLIQQLRELESMLQSEKEEFEEMLSQALKRETRPGQPAVDILEINKLRRQLIIYAYIWDQRLGQTSFVSIQKIQDKSSLPPKEKEKTASSGEKLANISTISTHSRAFSSCDSFLLKVKPDVTSVEEGDDNLCSPDGKDMDHNSSHIKDGKFSHSSSMNMDHKNSEDPSKAVRRVLSEGQFPIVNSLSDTLDAAWTGESQQVVVTSRGNGLAPPNFAPSEDSFIMASLVNQGMENCATNQKVPSGTGKSNGGVPSGAGKSNGGVSSGTGKSNGGVPSGTGKSNGGIWMPFSSFYASFDSPTNPEKFDRINCYNPVHILSFRELLNQNGARLLLPVGSNDAVVPVYDDEPTSIISYALVSPDYCSQMLNEYEKPKDVLDSSASLPILQSLSLLSIPSFDEAVAETLKFLGPTDEMISPSSASQSLSTAAPTVQSNGLHVRLCFSDDGPLGKVKYTVTCYFAKRFEALRQTCCPSELDFVRSLSRCKKWGAQGGKSNVFFAKTLDERFIIKQVTKTELESFIKFASSYFKYLSVSVSTGNPTCLAKILGIYQVISKHLKGGKESRMDVLVMENLLYRRNIVRLYDLKGSSRSRYNPDSSGSNKVLLDQNLLETMPTSPIFVGTRAKRLLERAVWNDTQFLASVDVMDYSLLVGVDEEKHELVLGIIDFMRQYTWDKHLETWVKASAFLGGSKNSAPTVISPMQYKKRFRKAMSAYFLMVPDQWSSSSSLPDESLP